MRFLPNSNQVLDIWNRLIQPGRPSSSRWPGCIVLLLIGALSIHFSHWWTGKYFSGVALVASVGVTLYAGVRAGFLSAVLLALFADYFYIPPTGRIFETPDSVVHFVGLVVLTGAMSLFTGSLRIALAAASRAKESAEEAVQAKDKVIALISHDLRNPLTAARAGAQLLIKFPASPERVTGTAKHIVSSLNRANQMIEDLLDAQMFRSGNSIPIKMESTNLRAMANEMINDLRISYGDRFELSADERIEGYWSSKDLRRAIENLATNAVKYGAKNTKITIRFEQSSREVRISVHNFGKPLSCEEQRRLFDTFHRTGSAVSGSQKGWGLGLTITQGIARAHGGTVSVTSAPGLGTTFILCVPKRARFVVSKSAS